MTHGRKHPIIMVIILSLSALFLLPLECAFGRNVLGIEAHPYNNGISNTTLSMKRIGQPLNFDLLGESYTIVGPVTYLALPGFDDLSVVDDFTTTTPSVKQLGLTSPDPPSQIGTDALYSAILGGLVGVLAGALYQEYVVFSTVQAVGYSTADPGAIIVGFGLGGFLLGGLLGIVIGASS